MNVIQHRLENGFHRRSSTDLIVIHAMAEVLEMNPDLPAAQFLDKMGLSAHCLIAPQGTVIRCREDDEGAYHAKGFNAHSVGVEILTPGTHTYVTWLDAIQGDWVSDEQYEAAIELVRGWMTKYNLTTDNVKRHSDIDPARKKDPGNGFKWEWFLKKLNG